jgi:lipid-A-disaccharide synthase
VPTLLLSAGDASGDLHAASFATAFQRRNPGTRLVGLGGDAMRAAGVELVADQRDLAVGGIFELFGSLHRVARAWRTMGAALERERPDLVVLVDSAGFNLPLARRIRRRLGVPILYYVAPQVWAWRTGRIRKLVARVDRLAVILPFEPEVYEGTGLRVDFVGHPLVDEIDLPDERGEGDEGGEGGEGDAGARGARRGEDAARASARRACGVQLDARVVTLLPGSRRNEIGAHLAVQLETARLLHQRDPRTRFVLAVAPSLRGAAGDALRAAGERETASGLPLTAVFGGAREAITAADVVLAKPGTVTVECALLGRPLVVMGRANPLTAWILRRAIRVPSLTMPNLIAEEAIVPEFLQQDAEPSRLAVEVASLMEGPAREAQLAGLAGVRRALGPKGAVERACGIAEEMLATART